MTGPTRTALLHLQLAEQLVDVPSGDLPGASGLAFPGLDLPDAALGAVRRRRSSGSR